MSTLYLNFPGLLLLFFLGFIPKVKKLSGLAYTGKTKNYTNYILCVVFVFHVSWPVSANYPVDRMRNTD